jgi:hypothetical protein
MKKKEKKAITVIFQQLQPLVKLVPHSRLMVSVKNPTAGLECGRSLVRTRSAPTKYYKICNNCLSANHGAIT